MKRQLIDLVAFLKTLPIETRREISNALLENVPNRKRFRCDCSREVRCVADLFVKHMSPQDAAVAVERVCVVLSGIWQGVSLSTINRWYNSYVNGGADALIPRKTKGRSKKVSHV